ncbi:hypothetical protein D3C75_870280 [compost metagenome]
MAQSQQMADSQAAAKHIIRLEAWPVQLGILLVQHNVRNPPVFQSQIQAQIGITLGAFGRFDNQPA